jgi:hypothetical protein
MKKPTKRQMEILKIMQDGRPHSEKDLRARFDTLQDMYFAGWIDGFLRPGCLGVKPDERLFRIDGPGFALIGGGE